MIINDYFKQSCLLDRHTFKTQSSLFIQQNYIGTIYLEHFQGLLIYIIGHTWIDLKTVKYESPFDTLDTTFGLHHLNLDRGQEFLDRVNRV